MKKSPLKRSPLKKAAGFTLLEVLVATLVMGIAVAGVLNGLAGASRNAARLTDYDRATLLAKQKMDELLMDRAAPRNRRIDGEFDPAQAPMRAGWSAMVTPFEAVPGMGPGSWGTDRVELEVWWLTGPPNAPTRHTFSLEGFRRGILQAGDHPF